MVPIVAFSGSSQTGKTTLAHMLANELECKFVSFGEYVRRTARERGLLEPSRSDLQDIGQELVESDLIGFCRSVLQTVNFSPGERLVIDGIRHKQALQAVSTLSKQQPIRLIYLYAPIEIRNARRTIPRGSRNLNDEDSHKVESQTNSGLRDLADLIVNTSEKPEDALSDILRWIEHECPELSQIRRSKT